MNYDCPKHGPWRVFDCIDCRVAMAARLWPKGRVPLYHRAFLERLWQQECPTK